jgi:glucose/arabinose dehydrogenase
MSLMGRLALAVTVLALCGADAGKGYRTDGTCGGFPRVALQTPPGLCVGLVAQKLGFARGVAELGHDIYVLDMGGWRRFHGRLLRLGHDGSDAPETLLTGLDEPSALAAAPGGALYVGVLGRVLRVTLSGPRPVIEDVVTDLPATGRHPLPAFAVAPDGSLYVNVGSGTDHCENEDGTPPDPKVACRESVGGHPRASIIRAVPGRAAVAWQATNVIATGLRNSMALAVMPGGSLIAAVNARDAINRADPSLSDAALPHDNFDVIRPGADYGWPYCFDDNVPSPEYKSHGCASAQKPTLLLPPHAAALGLLLYRGRALPELSSHLILPYHGYRTAGHRIMTLAIDADGRPSGPPTPLVWGWDGQTGLTPMGAPVAVAEMTDGTLLFSEDHNGTLLRLARAEGPAQ